MKHTVRIKCDAVSVDGLTDRQEDYIVIQVDANNRTDAVTAVANALNSVVAGRPCRRCGGSKEIDVLDSQTTGHMEPCPECCKGK